MEGTLSSLNTVNVNKKAVLTFSTSFTISEDSKIDKFSGRKTERKEFSIYKSLTVLVISVIVYYAVSVVFGAPVFEVYSDTLYFSVLMTLLTVYPLIWYYFFCDNLLPVLKILSDSKFDNLTESHLHSMVLSTVIGAWVGAFPIPLDWDRLWQTWPITCCIGASLGSSVVHLFIGSKIFYGLFRDRRKISYNRSV
ncbi:phosphatidylinositol-glycan biosynthesis class F protein [Trichonephila clavata]|uniref:Phosphatidylinositol-glycan biosynthesis class F protein n=1 Tax=Trichonephila clavata TaxID=2740835 RepID=A0A8X6FPB2_TRICU|nr:phosphatidylinositol-glycan biosynthesis class F protein [Trichonephila clavata]